MVNFGAIHRFSCGFATLSLVSASRGSTQFCVSHMGLIFCCPFCPLCPELGASQLSRAQCEAAWAPRPPRSAIKCVFAGRRFTEAEATALRVPRLRRTLRTNCQQNSMAPTGQADQNAKDPVNARVRVKEIIADSTLSNRWDECWKEGVTPWDVGKVTPVIQDLVDKGELPDGRALVPGCGMGYDVLALASESRQVVGLDISDTVNMAAKKMAAESPKGAWVEFLVADFFNYVPDATFNLIFDYTFFCAIDLALRPAWAAKMADLLTSDGELITLMFPLGEYDGGPPYAVSIKAYEEVLDPLGFTLTSCQDNELAVGERKGREKIGRWKKGTASSKI